MAVRKDASIPLGTPGQLDGRATTQSDRGDETQSLFKYQWTAAVMLLAAAMDGKTSYLAVWCEHHDDLLAEVPGGLYHAIQVKSLSGAGAHWVCSGDGFRQAIGKFCEHEANYSDKLEKYIFYSNAPPYIPGPTARSSKTLASSPMRLAEDCCRVDSYSSIAAPYRDSFDALVAASGRPADMVFAVLQKLEFMKGLSLESFEEHLATALSGVSKCKQMTIERLRKTRDALMSLVGGASSLTLPSIAVCTSVLQADGRPEVSIRAKRVSVQDVEGAIKQPMDAGFRYADSEDRIPLGNARGQKNVLKRKMTAGYVGNYFQAVWHQALAAEQRLMESAVLAPEAAKRKISQLQAAVLVACQNAEAKYALEPDERVRGIKIYQEILESTSNLAIYDRETVEHERAETLRGIAGLLSGSCQFAWGAPWIDGEDGNGS